MTSIHMQPMQKKLEISYNITNVCMKCLNVMCHLPLGTSAGTSSSTVSPCTLALATFLGGHGCKLSHNEPWVHHIFFVAPPQRWTPHRQGRDGKVHHIRFTSSSWRWNTTGPWRALITYLASWSFNDASCMELTTTSQLVPMSSSSCFPRSPLCPHPKIASSTYWAYITHFRATHFTSPCW